MYNIDATCTRQPTPQRERPWEKREEEMRTPRCSRRWNAEASVAQETTCRNSIRRQKKVASTKCRCERRMQIVEGREGGKVASKLVRITHKIDSMQSVHFIIRTWRSRILHTFPLFVTLCFLVRTTRLRYVALRNLHARDVYCDNCDSTMNGGITARTIIWQRNLHFNARIVINFSLFFSENLIHGKFQIPSRIETICILVGVISSKVFSIQRKCETFAAWLLLQLFLYICLSLRAIARHLDDTNQLDCEMSGTQYYSLPM